MTTAVYFTSTRMPANQAGQVYGITVAINDWIKAYFRFATTARFTFLIGHKIEQEDIDLIADEVGLDKTRIDYLDRRYIENYRQLEVIFRPDPTVRKILWLRQQTEGFAFCGLAHAISGAEVGDLLEQFCLAPSAACDAIVSPSQAVKGAIAGFWDSYADYLRLQFGASYQCPAQLPVIPLGIDIEKFERRATADKRVAQRAALGIADDEIVVLWVGRLSAAIKAHPLAMFQAVERAAELSGQKISLVMVGYFLPPEAEAQFKNLAAALCHKARVEFIDTHDARFSDGLWACGDIFLSLVDNMQESFGLTPIEAMAAGLPRVISDWDGYRDSVTDGEDGFLIRTAQPPPGSGFDLTLQVALERETYGGFLAKTALSVAVDAVQAGDRIALLAQNAELRAAMAAKARARVKAVYDWRHIIPRYEELWRELAARRRMPPRKPWPGAIPQLPDPYRMHQGYASRQLRPEDVLHLAASFEQIALLLKHDINTYAHDVMLPPDAISALLATIHKQSRCAIADIVKLHPADQAPRLWRTIGWLMKMGAIVSGA